MNNDIILTEFARVINSDRYQYTESDIFLVENMQNKVAVFDMFFRKTEDGGFAVVSGIQEVIHLIEVLNTTSEEEKRKYFLTVNKVINKDMWITYNKLWKSIKKRYLNIFLYCITKINRLLTIITIK